MIDVIVTILVVIVVIILIVIPWAFGIIENEYDKKDDDFYDDD